jgi:quercetin dioxygenase-like cupin family protein
VRLGHLVDGTPVGEGQPILHLRGQDHMLLSSREEMRFHVTESHIEPGASAGDELYTLPCDVEIVHVVEGALELRVGEKRNVLRAGDSFTYAQRDPHTWRNPVRDRLGRRPMAGRPESVRAAIIRPACGCSSVG